MAELPTSSGASNHEETSNESLDEDIKKLKISSSQEILDLEFKKTALTQEISDLEFKKTALTQKISSLENRVLFLQGQLNRYLPGVQEVCPDRLIVIHKGNPDEEYPYHVSKIKNDRYEKTVADLREKYTGMRTVYDQSVQNGQHLYDRIKNHRDVIDSDGSNFKTINLSEDDLIKLINEEKINVILRRSL